jgi:hypothetical protein
MFESIEKNKKDPMTSPTIKGKIIIPIIVWKAHRALDLQQMSNLVLS